MKKLLTVISLLMLFFANAECNVLYASDDSGSGGGSPAVSTAPISTATTVTDISAAFVVMVASTADNPGQLAELNSEYNACAAQRAALEATNPTAIKIPTDQYKSTLALLTDLMRQLWETIQSIIRNML
jgi:hypothetical protein